MVVSRSVRTRVCFRSALSINVSDRFFRVQVDIPWLFLDCSHTPAHVDIVILNVHGFSYFELAVRWPDISLFVLVGAFSVMRGKCPPDCGQVRRRLGKPQPKDKYHVCKDNWTRVGVSGDAPAYYSIDYLL